MKIYLAARYSKRLELCELKSHIESLGHTITSRWLLGGHQWNGMASAVWSDEQEAAGIIPPAAVRFAQDDIEDIGACDCLIAFPDTPREPSTSRGGMHVELGYALGIGKRIIVCGIRQNVFHLLPEVEFLETKQAVLAALSNGT